MSRSAWERKAPDAYWFKADTAPAISEALKDGNGAAVDLTGAAVRFKGEFPDAASDAQSIDQAATIVGSAVNGIVSYTPIAADTDTAGALLVRWKVTFGGGAIEHFPNSTPQKVMVMG